MLYITGIHALNLPCNLDTCGDWHQSGIQWDRPTFLKSDGSVFGDYGIEAGHQIPEHRELFNVANTIRALLDLLLLKKFSVAQGMNNDFIGNSKYDLEVFNKVIILRSLLYWNQISEFMKKEYRLKWINFLSKC